MRVFSQSFEHGQPIPGEFAFAVTHPTEQVQLSQNRNPHLAWEGAPEATRSFVITCIDDDVPTRAEDVNQHDREVPATLARCEFVHWLLINIPDDLHNIEAGSCSDGITPRGKIEPAGPLGCVQGENDYTSWFATDAQMQGSYRGYDGPCPPWNDTVLHHYHFTVLALDCARLNLPPGFGLGALREAMEGHVLDTATLTGTYTLNPRLT